MKKLRIMLTAALIAAVSLLLASCQKTDADILWYQQYPISAVVEANGATAYVSVDTDISVEIAEPDSLSGIRFIFRDGESYLTSGEMEIPIDKSDVPAVYPLGEFFKLKSEMISSVSNDGRSVVFKCDGREYTVEYDINGTPISFVCRYGGGEVSAAVKEIIPSNEKDTKNGEKTETENLGRD